MLHIADALRLRLVPVADERGFSLRDGRRWPDDTPEDVRCDPVWQQEFQRDPVGTVARMRALRRPSNAIQLGGMAWQTSSSASGSGCEPATS